MSRVVLAAFLLGTLTFFQQRYKIYPFPTSSVYYFAATVLALSVAYWYLLQIFRNLPFFAYLQISIDILLVTFLVHLTGGIDSGFSLLYHLTIISGSIILYRRGGYLSASLSSILYGAMLDMQYYNLLGFARSQNFTSAQVLYQVFISIISFYAVAFLSGYLSDRLRKTRQELKEKSTDFEDLRALQDSILRSVGSGIVTMDLEGRVSSWNPAAEQITGYRYAEIRERSHEVFGESIKGIFGHTDDLKEGPINFDGELIKKDGQRLILGMTASLLKDEKDAVRGIILTFQDITKIVEMEERVRRQDRLATIGSLAAGIAHEIRNPLASLSGSIQVLRKDLDLQGDNQRLMDIVLREAERLNTIITDFLEYARPRASSLEEISLSSLIDETIMLLRNSKNFREDISITCDVASSVLLQADAQRLRQVFWNLLINGCQALPGGGEIMISAMTGSRNDGDTEWLRVVIADNGQGIAREDIDKIFHPFFTTKSGGTGLGLAIVYRIIEDHGGTIDVESEPGKGTRFIIMLPMVEEAIFAHGRSKNQIKRSIT
jgi:two-component system sensor histidine kinase PilS (NtrC family)